ncbi:helix-turn-helix domain-containing protein [Candidatus Hakubella thermalkaliphila]|uniref:Insertion element IS150 protein InsJ-like helix-turn-helix domain-containing protein n=1 Tax=Candidatus Hakubella thermalkaliphila TaxID=2754717 RepID=A0A6V8P9Z1_9ACTN|nr:helix-turn-helix domain-containing protein [Candidatus Hakubella thermalkaliphila]GFP29087.1 hypothetical protein HKBW3S34_00005 [Candidatus Hakubella thermalkaliphila]
MPKSVHLRWPSAQERKELERWGRSRSIPVGLWKRAILILDISRGRKLPEVAREIKLDAVNARKWIHRFNEQGLPGLKEREGRGRPSLYETFL